MGDILNGYEVSAFYRFVSLPNATSLLEPIRSLCTAHGIRGTILLAPEGINGTIAGSRPSLAAAMAGIRDIPEFNGLEAKTSFAPLPPFKRLKVRLKKEIVTLGVKANPLEAVGHYVAPQDWNVLIADPEVLLIDTRNHFEVMAGTFEGALDPQTQSFGEFPAFVRNQLLDQKSRRIAMFCTGGIRCEKATSFLVSEGFQQVYHLQGGILKYLEVIAPEHSLWRGDCFVFDERGALGHGLAITGTTSPSRPEEA